MMLLTIDTDTLSIIKSITFQQIKILPVYYGRLWQRYRDSRAEAISEASVRKRGELSLYEKLQWRSVLAC